MPRVEQVNTPVSVEQARAALEAAWVGNVGEPNGDIITLMLTLWALETGNGASMFNFNMGNIVAVSESQDYWIGDDSGNTRKFRSWSNLDAGATGLVRQLTSETRPHWHAGVLSGDPENFVKSLKGVYGGPAYFEADLDVYLIGFFARHRELLFGAQSHALTKTEAQTERGQSVFSDGTPETCSLGASGQHVMLMQALLNSWFAGDGDLVLNGQFELADDDSVRDFQRFARHDVIDGICGPKTWTDLLWFAGNRWQVL